MAAKHTIVLTSIEWQGRTSQETTYAAIGEAGTMAILDRLLAKYPQIDPSRVCLTGLSAGAMNSFGYGVNNLRRIAGVAGHSAPFGPPTLLDAAAKAKSAGQYLPMYAIAGNHDMYRRRHVPFRKLTGASGPRHDAGATCTCARLRSTWQLVFSPQTPRLMEE